MLCIVSCFCLLAIRPTTCAGRPRERGKFAARMDNLHHPDTPAFPLLHYFGCDAVPRTLLEMRTWHQHNFSILRLCTMCTRYLIEFAAINRNQCTHSLVPRICLVKLRTGKPENATGPSRTGCCPPAPGLVSTWVAIFFLTNFHGNYSVYACVKQIGGTSSWIPTKRRSGSKRVELQCCNILSEGRGIFYRVCGHLQPWLLLANRLAVPSALVTQMPLHLR